MNQVNRANRTKRQSAWLAALMGIWASGCGYHFQRSDSPYLRDQGIRTVYISPTMNLSYKPGIEMFVQNELLKTVAARGSLKIVNSEEDADAILRSTVGSADYVPGAPTSANTLGPSGFGFDSRLPRPTDALETFAYQSIATIYTGSLGCSFSLERTHREAGKPDVIWSDGFSRAKPFPGANQLDVPGTTSALINESEFDRVLTELTTQIVTDAHDSMVAAF